MLCLLSATRRETGDPSERSCFFSPEEITVCSVWSSQDACLAYPVTHTPIKGNNDNYSNCKCFAQPVKDPPKETRCRRFSSTQACPKTPTSNPNEPIPKANQTQNNPNNQSRSITMRAKRRNTLTLRLRRPQINSKLAIRGLLQLRICVPCGEK